MAAWIAIPGCALLFALFALVRQPSCDGHCGGCPGSCGRRVEGDPDAP